MKLKQKQILLLLLSVIMMFSLSQIVIFAEETSKTIDISSAEGLIEFKKTVETGTYEEIIANLNMDIKIDDTGVNIAPKNQFKVTFNGNNHIITLDNCSYGLFNYNNGTIKDLIISGSIKNESDFYIGGIANINEGIIQNCYNKCTVSGNDYVGGIAGYNCNTIQDCHNESTISGNDYVGGIAGYNCIEAFVSDTSGDDNNSDNCIIQNCYNTGTIYGNNYIGGIAGYNCNTIQDCHNESTISENGCIGQYSRY